MHASWTWAPGGRDMPLAFAERGWRTTGLDTNPDVLLVARRETAAQPLVEIVAGDGRSLPFDDGSFDVAHASLFVHHFEPAEVVAVLGELRRVARRGVVVNDLRRGLMPLLATGASALAFGRSRVTWTDGIASARRVVHADRARRAARRGRTPHPVAFEPLDATRRDGRLGRTMSVTTRRRARGRRGSGRIGAGRAPGRGGRIGPAGRGIAHTRAPRRAPSTPARGSSRSSPGWASDPAWTELAVPLEGMDLHAGGRMTPIRYADGRGPRSAWGVDRRTFDAMLARHAVERGRRARWNGRASHRLVVEAGRVRGARVRDVATGAQSEVRADWTVGADGTRSTISRLVGVDRPVRFPRRLGLVAHYAGIAELADHGEMHVGPDWYVGLAPTPGGELNVGMALPLDGTAAGTTAGRFEAAIAALPAVAQAALGQSDASRRSAAPPRSGTASRARQVPDGSSSATPRASSIRSPARASTARCARHGPRPTRSWAPATLPRPTRESVGARSPRRRR